MAVELRPPRAELEAAEGMDAWIDTYHAIRSLTRHDVRVMVTDSAVGAQEENNLRHLVTNLGDSVGRHKVIPFLTTKHSLEFCLAYADQAVHNGFPSLVVLGGDKHVGRARSLEHAWQLRQLIRERHPQPGAGRLGESDRGSDQAGRLPAAIRTRNADFYLTQIVSHHQGDRVGAFLDAGRSNGLTMPGVFGVFYYRSANSEDARNAEPVPAGPGRRAEDGICRRRDADRCVRPHDSIPNRHGCAAFLRQQLASEENRRNIEYNSGESRSLS